MNNSERNIRSAIAGAVTKAVKDNPDAGSIAIRPIAEEVIKQAAPVILHATNNEEWYRSRVTWGAIASIALPLLGAFGVSTDIIDADQFVALGLALGTAAGGVFTLYGRWKARKPIGA